MATSEWARERVEVMRRNEAIRGRNRNIDALNEMLGTEFEPMPLELMPTARGGVEERDDAESML